MGIGTTVGVLGGIGAAGSIGGAAIGSAGANNAANSQANAADYAANLQHQDAQSALQFQENQYNTEQGQIAPWLSAGTTAINQLAGEKVPDFQAPTAATEQNDPGYQFRLQQGMEALQNSAAAHGAGLSGNTLKGINDYAQNYASNEYGNVYNRAMNEYNTNVIAPYNRTAALAGVGQQAQATGAQQGQAAASNISNIDLTSGQQIGNDVVNAGAARASGYVGGANAWSGALGGAASSAGNSVLLSQLLNSSSYAPINPTAGSYPGDV